MPAPRPKVPELPPEYLALRRKIDAFSDGVVSRRGADLQCRAGCASCCHVELSVSAVEAAAIRAYFAALPAGPKRALRAALRRRPAASSGAGDPPRCAMLLEDDRCAIYAARPLVCRSQGLPLLYPAEAVPEAARRGLGADGRALSICPLNFVDAKNPPGSADVLDAERVDVLLSLINRRAGDAAAASKEEACRIRYGLADLAQEFVE
jgi:hypothetical protein